jgi:hypothetical protein
MRHPLDFIPSSIRRQSFLGLLIWTLALFALFQVLNLPLTTTAAPYGIVSHQLAWTPEKSQAILASWGKRASLFAAFGLGLDYLFMPSYALTVAIGTLLVAGRHKGWFFRTGSLVAYGAFVGILFDALENIGQAVQLLNGTVNVSGTIFVGICATFKFTLLLLGVLYLLVVWILPKEN